ncbi:hypothetical protein Y1Q_0021650 [Alligator mississippiensis]|uniref:Uncharacterized protein n=1 Tax=Alligator mississippiensis TaxID=8496 RepID=A0A151PAL5_ALLMI|nr:hypothetical protein Y1Q_0021650 [Alligator mississippiensis]
MHAMGHGYWVQLDAITVGESISGKGEEENWQDLDETSKAEAPQAKKPSQLVLSSQEAEGLGLKGTPAGIDSEGVQTTLLEKHLETF